MGHGSKITKCGCFHAFAIQQFEWLQIIPSLQKWHCPRKWRMSSSLWKPLCYGTKQCEQQGCAHDSILQLCGQIKRWKCALSPNEGQVLNTNFFSQTAFSLQINNLVILGNQLGRNLLPGPPLSLNSDRKHILNSLYDPIVGYISLQVYVEVRATHTVSKISEFVIWDKDDNSV